MTTLKDLLFSIENKIRTRADSEIIMGAWIGMARRDRVELAVAVQRDQMTVAGIVDTISAVAWHYETDGRYSCLRYPEGGCVLKHNCPDEPLIHGCIVQEDEAEYFCAKCPR